MTVSEKKSVISAKERFWVGFGFTVCLIYYFIRVICIAVLAKTCYSAVSTMQCNNDSPYYTTIIISITIVYIFLLLVLLKSSYMIQCSIEDQRIC